MGREWLSHDPWVMSLSLSQHMTQNNLVSLSLAKAVFVFLVSLWHTRSLDFGCATFKNRFAPKCHTEEISLDSFFLLFLCLAVSSSLVFLSHPFMLSVCLSVEWKSEVQRNKITAGDVKTTFQTSYGEKDS